MRTVISFSAAALSLVAFARPAFAEGSRRLRLDECVATALRQNPDVVNSAEEIRAAEASRGEVNGEFYPKLRAEAAAQQWNSAFSLPFGATSFPVRDAFTWNASVSLIQPVTALFAIYQTYKIRDLGVDVAAIRREVARRDTAYRVVEAYYRVLQSERLSEVALGSVDQLEGQLRQAKSFHDNGVVGQNDVLRAQLAVANAKQRLIQLRTQVTIGRSRLAVLMGLPPDSEIDAEPLVGEPPGRDATTIEQAEQRAVSGRVELREVDRRIEQADRGVRVAWLKLAPQVNLVGVYQHNEGAPLVLTNQGFVGATASWDVFDWGTTTSGISGARSRLRQAFTARTKIDHEVRLEVRKAYLDVGAAVDAMGVAKSAVAQAEENFRLVTKRYEANAATSFDVVDAESLLTLSRAQLQTSLYDYLVAGAALRRSTGEAP